MPFAQSLAARSYWRLQGTAALPPLVLLNGFGTEQDMHDQAAPYLEQHFRLLRIDNRGHGASYAPPGDYSLGMLELIAFNLTRSS